MEQSMRFELVIWAGWLNWKKAGVDYKKIWGYFFTFSGAKKLFSFFKKYCSVRTKKLYKMELRKPQKKFFKI